jgi:hypothetical protein
MTPAQSDDINRELQATLQARRELGTTAYDEHFIEALVEKLRAEARAAQPQHRDVGPPSDQRLALAICSLIFGIPLIAIVHADLIGLILVCVTLLGINAAFNARR